MKARIIRVTGRGPQFTNLTPGSVHEVIEPSKEFKKKFPNTRESVWVMGEGEPVRLFTHGRDKEAVIINETEPGTDTGSK
jgi:hypothetical protein